MNVNQFNPLCTLLLCSFKIHSSIIDTSRPGSPKWFLPFSFPTKILQASLYTIAAMKSKSLPNEWYTEGKENWTELARFWNQ
jgi:hypothetical protein